MTTSELLGPLSEEDPVARQRQALLFLVQLDKSELEVALPRILEADARALRVERVSFWRLAGDRTRIVCARLFTLSQGRFSSGDELLASDFPRYFAALLENRAILAHEARSDPRTSEFTVPYFSLHGISSMLDVPVWHRGQLVGVVCHEHVGPPRRWLQPEVDFAVSVGGMIAAGLEGDARGEAEARYRLLTAAMQDLVWDWDLRTDHIAWSESVISSLGFDPGQVRPSLQWWKEHVHPEDLQRVMDGLTRHAESGSGVWMDEYRFRRGDGSWAIILDRGVVQRAPDGGALRMVGAMMDVTEQRRLEARLALSDRMASVGTLAAGVAHEINNPLTYVRNNLAYSLKAHLRDGGRDPQVEQALLEAADGVERVQQIVRDLKTLSRPVDPEPRAVDVREVISSALAITQNELRHRATVRVVHDQALVPVLGSPARLGQVLINLLVNAAQAIPEGHADQHEVLVQTSMTTSGAVRVEVRDTGVGIAPELLARIFDPFFTTKKIGEGVGLGLAICHSIVTGIGGSLTLENNPDRGALARVELLPATGPLEPEPARTPVPLAPRSARRGRVLIIDDHPNVALSMQRLLEEHHEVTCLTRAREALEALGRGQRWDVILCDLMMPELSGMDFVAELERTSPALVPGVVLMSGGTFTERASAFLERWPHRQLEKPIPPERLVEEIARAVERAGSGGSAGLGR